MKLREKIIVLTIAMLAMLQISICRSQSLAGGAIEGTVADKSGAVVSGATLTLRNPATGVAYTSTSDAAGSYVFPVVSVGKYELTGEKSGYATAKMKSVEVSVGSKLNLPITLQVANASETVQVTGEVSTVDVDRTSVATNVNERAIESLPVNGRNFIDFTLLTPGVSRDTRGGDLSFAGQRGTMNSLTIDGTDDNNTFYGQTAARTGFKTPYQFSQDSVQEFQVATNGYSAEIGRAGGAVINVVTKSGTNQFHGDAFEFYRDQSLNAYDPTQKLNAIVGNKAVGPKTKYHYNQFGGDLGGPILKNRAFFFFDLDDQRNVLPVVMSAFPTVASPTTEQTAALNYLNARHFGYNKTNEQNTYLLKTDYVLNQHNQLSARWNRQRYTAGEQENAGSTSALEHTGNSYIHTDNANVALTSTLTPRIVNVARFAFLKDREPGAANSANAEGNVKQSGATLLSVGRNDFSPRETTIHQEQYSDNVTWAINRQTIKVGGDVLADKIKNLFPGNFYGNFTFVSLQDFGCSLLSEAYSSTGCYASTSTNFIQAFAGTGTTGATTHPDTLMPDFFVQDDIRLTRKLTVNLGLRYDYQSVKYSGVQNATALTDGYDTSKQHIANNEWGPRFGFAWNPTQKLVLRGGYGLFFGTTNSMLLGTAMSNNGINVGTYTYYGASMPYYPNTLCGTPGSPLCSAPTGGSSSASSIDVVANSYQNPVVQEMNLGVEYQLAPSLSVSLGGLRAKGDHIQRTADQNLGTLTTATIADNAGNTYSYLTYPSTRPISAFTRISLFESNADSNYNGLIAQLNKHFSQGLQGTLSYTWSHVIDNAPDATSVVVGNSGDDAKIAMYPTRPWLDRGNGVNDIRHRLVLSYVAELPHASGLPRAAAALVNGWNTSGILSVQSGLPYSAMVSGNLLNEGNSYNNRLPGSKRNGYHMPMTWSFDPRLSRNVEINSERGIKLQLFAEGFNLFNHFNINAVNTYSDVLSSGVLVQKTATAYPTSYFGLPSGTTGQRIFQLGSKIVF